MRTDTPFLTHHFSSTGTFLITSVRGKGKVIHRTGHEDPDGEWRYLSTLSLTSALDGVGGQRHAPAALTPGKRPGTHCI